MTDLARAVPGECPLESKRADMGKSIKSYREEMGLWTNCREFGSCTSDGRRHGSKPEETEEEDE